MSCYLGHCGHSHGARPCKGEFRVPQLCLPEEAAPLRSRRIQNALIAAQVAFSMVLMIAGSMLIHSSISTLETDPGLDCKQRDQCRFAVPDCAKVPRREEERSRCRSSYAPTKLSKLLGCHEKPEGVYNNRDDCDKRNAQDQRQPSMMNHEISHTQQL
jgi:hypothetical protein